jgi:hypothetical protein
MLNNVYLQDKSRHVSITQSTKNTIDSVRVIKTQHHHQSLSKTKEKANENENSSKTNVPSLSNNKVFKYKVSLLKLV